MVETRIVEAPALDPGRPLLLPGRGRVVVRDEGKPDATPIVFLHGWTVTADLNFFGQYAAVGQAHRVIAFDQAGHGTGLRPRRRVSIKSLADDTIAVADALEIDRFVPVGYSLGGAVAQVLARDYPDRLAGLVFSATVPRFLGSDLRLWPATMLGVAGVARVSPRRMVDGIFGRMLAKRTDGLHPWGFEQVRDHDPRILLEIGSSLFAFDGTAELGDVRLPTAVVVTEADRKTRPVSQRRFGDYIPGTTLHPVDGAHDAPIVAPHEYNRGLLAALDSVLNR